MSDLSAPARQVDALAGPTAGQLTSSPVERAARVVGHGKDADLRFGHRVHERVRVAQQDLAPGAGVDGRRRLRERDDLRQRQLYLGDEALV